MPYQDPYDPKQSQPTTYQNWSHDQGGQRHGDSLDDMSQSLWQQQHSQEYGQNYEWTPYGDPGQSDDESKMQPKSFDPKYGYSNYQYPPNRRTSQKSSLSMKYPSREVVPVPPPVPDKHTSGFEKGEFVPKRRTPSAYREYRYGNQGRLWTKNGPLRTAGRFCFCTLLTILFLVVSIALSLVLWLRPPDIEIGNVQSTGGLQKISSGGFQANLSTVIAVKNFNYFNVQMRRIQVEVFYPIDDTPIGGGAATDILFKSGTQTNFTFPFSLTYDPSNDASGQVLTDIAKKCGVGGQKSDLSVKYKLTLGIQVLLFTLSPVVSNVFTFACPVSSSDITKIFPQPGS